MNEINRLLRCETGIIVIRKSRFVFHVIRNISSHIYVELHKMNNNIESIISTIKRKMNEYVFSLKKYKNIFYCNKKCILINIINIKDHRLLNNGFQVE